MSKSYFVYLGRSLLPNENQCITAGITHVQYRDYLKVMDIFFMLPCKCKAHALAVEKEAHRWLDTHYGDRAFVRWSKADFELSKIDKQDRINIEIKNNESESQTKEKIVK